jgi:hypothetical protein
VDHTLDDLADRLRERLLVEAGDAAAGSAPLPERIRALVDREAGLLDAHTREDLADSIARRCKIAQETTRPRRPVGAGACPVTNPWRGLHGAPSSTPRARTALGR